MLTFGRFWRKCNPDHAPFMVGIFVFVVIDNRFIDLLVDKSIIDFARSIIDVGADRNRLSTSKSISKTSVPGLPRYQ